MTSSTKPECAALGAASPAAVAALEKIPHAARRMGMSTSNFYRTARRDGLRIVKVSERASAVVSEDVTAWIQRRIAACSGVVK